MNLYHLACGGMDAIEQPHMWDEAAFDGYVRENHPGEAQAAAMAAIPPPVYGLTFPIVDIIIIASINWKSSTRLKV